MERGPGRSDGEEAPPAALSLERGDTVAPMQKPLLRAVMSGAVLILGLSVAGCTPKLGEEVPLTDLFSKADLDGKYVTTTGRVRVGVGLMGSSSCDRTSCTLDLAFPEGAAAPAGSARKSLTLYTQVGSGENEMSELPDKYSKEDLKIKVMGGKVVGHDALVKVTGKLKCKLGDEASLPCSMRVDRIDAP